MIQGQPKSIAQRAQRLTSCAPAAVLIAIFLQLVIVPSLPSLLRAESQYVIPSSEIPVRRGQGTDYKIIALVTDGTRVEVIERGESYSLVRLDNDKQGWILSRFLSDEPPLTQVVEELTRENEALKLQQGQNEEKLVIQEQQSSQKLNELSQTLMETEQTLQATQTEKAAIAASFEKLRKDTANVIEIKQQLTDVTGENKAIKEKLTILARENEKLINDERVSWFLAGGGVLLLGIIIGKITSRSRKRKPSLM